MSKPLSLTQLFEAPEGYIGSFGWLCGYSADAAFLDNAVERFTRQTRLQRAQMGRIWLALMLDPGNPQIAVTDAPGVAHLPMKNMLDKPFALLHAKCALLCFVSEDESESWLFRLILSTGNWTTQTLEESLDLAWRCEITKVELGARDIGVSQRSADMASAWDCLSWLQDLFDVRVLRATLQEGGLGENGCVEAAFRRRIKEIVARGGASTPRLVHNRNQAFLSQVASRVRRQAGESGRNYIALGSGFYESVREDLLMPEMICDLLKKQGLLTQRPEADIFVNPTACQAIATSMDHLREAGFEIRPAGIPGYFGEQRRGLHAKFIFSAYQNEASEACNSAWLYLGSGNLTRAGFGLAASNTGGNFEMGVVVDAPGLYWGGGGGREQHAIVTEVLPIQWDRRAGAAYPISEGQDFLTRGVQYMAGPIAWMRWREELSGCYLEAPNEVFGGCDEIQVTSLDGCVCEAIGPRQFAWVGAQPREVRLRWRVGAERREAVIPVLDAWARVGAIPLPSVDLEEAWWLLASFPGVCENADVLVAEIDREWERHGDQSEGPVITQGGIYPIRAAMTLVENIAAKQTQLSQVDWAAWCVRLEQVLTQAADDGAIAVFSRMGVNPLSPLWHRPFRPDFAETSETPEGTGYEAALGRLERAWKLEKLARIGGRYA